MTSYSIVKSPRSGYLIDDGSGFSIRYATKHAAEIQIAKLVRAEADAAQHAISVREARLAAVSAYLAVRATRKSDQIEFAF